VRVHHHVAERALLFGDRRQLRDRPYFIAWRPAKRLAGLQPDDI
jgi:hypothetical protein